MPAAKAKAPKYCLHKPSGRAYIRIRGRVRYIDKYGTPESLEVYGRLVAELAAHRDTPAPPQAQAELTVVELACAYWKFANGYYRKKDGTPSGWLKHIQLVLSKHLSGLYGRTPATEFGPLKFKAIRQTLIDAGHSRPYINKLMAIIPQVFKWAAAEELVPASVFHTLRTVAGLKKGRTKAPEPEPVLPVEDTLVDATLPHLPEVVADMVRFERLTGCRPGEVCQLRPMDVNRSGEVWTYYPESHKTEHHGRERVILIGPKAQVVIRPYLLRDSSTYCFSPAETMQKMREARHVARKTPLRYGNRPGTNRKARPARLPRIHYTKDSYNRAIRRAIDRANKVIQQAAAASGTENPMMLP
jgi:integrase